MSLEDVPRSYADASVAAAGDADVASDIQGASSEKVQECSRKRKLDDLKQELSNKQRKLEAYRRELQATIDRKLKELRQEVTEKERKERASFKVTVDTQSGRRKVWRRKQGNSSTQKTSGQPRPLKRLPENSQHPGSTEAASQ
ncbi:uncharacterized protein [Haliotis asinina]|uniref:uncharacterized protein n=1 Tax=Haliotis asinina TaxID=109174 RepID=UPI0035319DEB